MFGVFLFCLDLELFAKIKKLWFLNTCFQIFNNNSRSKQNKKIPNTLLYILLSIGNMCKVSEKILNSMVVGARQSFNISDI